MFSINRHRDVSRKQLRSFGLVLAGGFLVVGSWPFVFRFQDPRWWAVAIGFLFGLGGLFAPTVLLRPYQAWMFMGDCLGWVNTRIILGSLFYLIITPMRAAIVINGRDPMNRKFDPMAETYRVVRKARNVGHMNHQF